MRQFYAAVSGGCQGRCIMMGCVSRRVPILLALPAVLLMGWFSPEISDTDFWWHLKTGQYIYEHHALPVPDPFAYTSAMGAPAYAGEERTRYFNLTHEWLTQWLVYGIYRAAGFGGVVLFRAALLTAFCGIAGWIAYRRCGGVLEMRDTTREEFLQMLERSERPVAIPA